MYVMSQVIETARLDPALNAGLLAARARQSEFPSMQAMDLAGLAMVPAGRDMLTRNLARYWTARTTFYLPAGAPEVVIGAGLHAAIYCASRVAAGYPKPLVLERGPRVGGAFAITDKPSFYLNSGNRPGQFGRPDRSMAGLNYLPGAPVQPDLISGREYQTNADVAYAVRATLAEYAEVITGAEVADVTYSGLVTLTSGRTIQAERVIDARGLGNPNMGAQNVNGITVQTFPQFLGSLDSMFPLQGLSRVAVIGGGDSGKVTVEALLGIGPAETSLTGLDYVRSVDWYARNLPTTCGAWADSERGRYARIGRYLPRDTSGGYDGAERLRVYRETGDAIPTLGGALVGTRAYDRAILATGYQLPSLGLSESRFYATPGNLAKSYDAESVIYRIGPAANLAFDDSEFNDGYADNPANRVAIFRLAPRTAALATILREPANPYA